MGMGMGGQGGMPMAGMQQMGGQQGVPAPMFVNVQPGTPVYCIDVECVATGKQHHDRSVAQIAMVDMYQRLVFNLVVKPDKPVVSYLEPLTGLNKKVTELNI